jgi:putative glycosyltransferase (TIGR04372 family)
MLASAALTGCILIRLLRPFVTVRVGPLISSRIGHFASNTELYLCERAAAAGGRRSFDIFYHLRPVCNQQLKLMWERSGKLNILPYDELGAMLARVNRLLPGCMTHSIVTHDRDTCGLIENGAPALSFTQDERQKAQAQLQAMGITNGSKFICLHSRDSAYLDARKPGYWDYLSFRNSSIENFTTAAEELAARGYYVLRIGAKVERPLRAENPRVIDYAVKFRTDFLDIFLGAGCAFYLGDSCGITAIPFIFRRPAVLVNYIPMAWVPSWWRGSLFIPKKIWLRRQGRFLTFGELLGSENCRIYLQKEYNDLGIEPVENTAEEIAAVAREMDERIKGEWRESEEDARLQEKFWSLFKPGIIQGKVAIRAGAEFLRQNRDLLV